MGWRYSLDHANFVAYLASDGSAAPPRAEAESLRQFIQSLRTDDGRTEFAAKAEYRLSPSLSPAPSGMARASLASGIKRIVRRWRLGHEGSLRQNGPLRDLYPCLHRARA